MAYLRHLETTPEPELPRSPRPQPPSVIRYFAPSGRLDPFRQSSCWVACLTKGRAEADAAYENVNCAGSTFPISPLRDLDALKVESLPDALVLLFREYVEFERTELKELEQQIR